MLQRAAQKTGAGNVAQLTGEEGWSLIKRVNHLWEQLVSEENLRKAIQEVNKSHRWRTHHRPNKTTVWIELNEEIHIKGLQRILEEGFVPQAPDIREHWDASAKKWRTVSEPKQWPDQYIHHALIQVLQPVFMRGMDPYCAGSIRKRGSHFGVKAISGWMKHDPKGTKYCLQLDIRHFYQSLEPEIVMNRMRELIKDYRVLDLIERIISDGILIGAYTSQWFANTVLQPLDHLIREDGYGVSHYLRYMDNFTVFGSNKRKLRQLRKKIEEWFRIHELELKDDWQIFPTAKRLPSAMGYRYGKDYIIPRKYNYLRMKRGISRWRKRLRQGRRITTGIALSLISRLGALKHCNNVHLYRYLFQEERVLRKLKTVVRRGRRNQITWNTFLEQIIARKSFAQKAIPIVI